MSIIFTFLPPLLSSSDYDPNIYKFAQSTLVGDERQSIKLLDILHYGFIRVFTLVFFRVCLLSFRHLLILVELLFAYCALQA